MLTKKEANSRNPEIFKKMSEWISLKLAEFGDQHLGYNPVIPIPFQIQVDKDKKFLTYTSYSNIALIAALYIHRVVNTPPLQRSSVREQVVGYYNDQRLCP